MRPELNKTVVAETVNDAFERWHRIMLDQYEQGRSESLQGSRDGAVAAEFINATTIVTDPTKNIVTSDIRKMPMRYAVGELLWYLSGSDKVSAIRPFSKAWDKLSDDGETVNSAYGYRIFHKFGFDQWAYVKKLLQEDPNSRQAVIHIKGASAEKTKDLPCTVALQYFIRYNKLYATTYMRSNDVWLGFPYDVFTFTCLQIKMAMELGVEVGTYTHYAGSFHMYARNLPPAFLEG